MYLINKYISLSDICLTVHHWYKYYRQPTRCNNNGLLIIAVSKTCFGQNKCPKHVLLTGIINKPLLLHLFGCLYYLYFIIFFWDFLNNLNLTLILKTWRIWWAPNNACKWQMGFNSSFKGYMIFSPILLSVDKNIHFNIPFSNNIDNQIDATIRAY